MIEPIYSDTALVFLDIDGVLNPHDFNAVALSNLIDRDKVAHLNLILDTCEARIVLSSAWRYLAIRPDMTLDGLDWLLRSHGVKAGTLAGITHPDTPTKWDEERGVPIEFVANERAVQVRRWRAANRHTGAYVVIDDMDFGFNRDSMPFVQTHGKIGLTGRHAAHAIQVLEDQMR